MISTRMTFVQKFVTPLFIPLFFALVWWQGSAVRFDRTFDAFAVAAFAVSIVWYALVFWPAKVVRIDDNNLYVSNFMREATIPIADIESVSDFILSEPRRVSIKLKKPSEFGSTIIFLAKYRWYSGFDAHPIVDELTRLAAQKRGDFFPSMLNIPS